MATGTLNSTLQKHDEFDVFISRDGGLSWEETLKVSQKRRRGGGEGGGRNTFYSRFFQFINCQVDCFELLAIYY